MFGWLSPTYRLCLIDKRQCSASQVVHMRVSIVTSFGLVETIREDPTFALDNPSLYHSQDIPRTTATVYTFRDFFVPLKISSWLVAWGRISEKGEIFARAIYACVHSYACSVSRFTRIYTHKSIRFKCVYSQMHAVCAYASNIHTFWNAHTCNNNTYIKFNSNCLFPWVFLFVLGPGGEMLLGFLCFLLKMAGGKFLSWEGNE